MAPLDNASTYLSQTVVRSRPMRAVLLGCGTVGGTLATRLPQGVALEAIALQRWRAVATPLGRPAVRVLDDLDAALDLGPELVIDALPGCEAAERAPGARRFGRRPCRFCQQGSDRPAARS